jgi:hypothetical protein
MQQHLKQYQVARSGQVVGVYSLRGLVDQLDNCRLTLDDHYWTEGMTDWLPLSHLTEHLELARGEIAKERELARESAEAQAKAESDAMKARAEAAEKDRLEKERVELEAKAAEFARQKEEYARAHGPHPWKCHTCAQIFPSKRNAAPYPEASGVWFGIVLAVIGALLMLMGTIVPVQLGWIFFVGAAIIWLFSTAHILAYSVERGLQQFHSYRPRCPNCSSPYCSKMADESSAPS